MGTFGERGNGDYRGELLRGAKVMVGYQAHLQFALDHALVRLDGLSGNGALARDLDAVGLRYVMRGKDYDLLDLPEIQTPLALPPDQQITHPETGTHRALFDFPEILLTPTGPRSRVIVASILSRRQQHLSASPEINTCTSSFFQLCRKGPFPC
jgi:hypothetical protein